MKYISLLVTTFFTTLFFFSPANAAERIDNFSATVQVQSDATILVTERIDYNFDDQWKHGIFRDIPHIYDTPTGTYTTPLSVVSVTDGNGNPLHYTVDGEYDYYTKRIKIGDADKTISGQKTYVITYTVDGAINYFDDHDELYWNVTGNDWIVPIGAASARIILPDTFRTDDLQKACFQGYEGVTTTCKAATWQYASDKKITGATFTALNLSEGEGLTVVVGFPKGFVAVRPHIIQTYDEEQPSFIESIQQTTNQPWIFVIPFFILGYTIVHYWRHGRDPKGHGTIIAEFDAPNKLTPAQAGTLVDNRADNRDFTAEIIQTAINGYITITRIPKSGFFGKDDFELAILKDTKSLPAWQKDLLNALFLDSKKITISSLSMRRNLQTEMYNIGADIFSTLVDKGYYTANPQSERLKNMIRGSVVGALIGVSGVLLGWMWIIVGLISGFILIFMSFTMTKRTVKGVEAKEHILGLKLYLSVAEKDRLTFHNAPDKDPKTFEKLLPYAMVLGVEKQWAQKFASIYTTQPTWYHDPSLTGFNAVIFANNLGTFHSATTHSFSSSGGRSRRSASSGHSGFSGGSSGGGFGGGGGGSW